MVGEGGDKQWLRERGVADLRGVLVIHEPRAHQRHAHVEDRAATHVIT